MKTLASLLLALALPLCAQDPAPAPATPPPTPPATPATPPPAPAPATAPAVPIKPEAPGKSAPKAKPLPFKATVDELTATTFTVVTKTTKSVNTITNKTVVENASAPAKFTDIKVGDTVSGTRVKTADGAYEIVKITQFSAAKTKAPKADAKPGTKPKAK